MRTKNMDTRKNKTIIFLYFLNQSFCFIFVKVRLLNLNNRINVKTAFVNFVQMSFVQIPFQKKRLKDS